MAKDCVVCAFREVWEDFRVEKIRRKAPGQGKEFRGSPGERKLNNTIEDEENDHSQKEIEELEGWQWRGRDGGREEEQERGEDRREDGLGG